MDTFIQLTVDGLTLGSVYALIALGYTLVYGVLKLLNFAHGDVFMVGSFIGFGVLQALGGTANPMVPVWLLLVLVTAAAMVGCAGLGVVIERFAYRPLRDAPRIAPLISALGVSFFLANSMQLLVGAEPRNYDIFSLDNGSLYLKGIDIGNVRVPLLRIITISAAFVLMVFLWILVNRTRTGKAMRATSFDREAAAMMGINIDRVIVFTFVLSGALAGAAGVMFALRVPTLVSIGFVAGLKGFTAAVIGGIGSIPGAMAGGLILGFAESYTQGYITTKWSDLIVFSILILFMLFRPQGLLGQSGHPQGMTDSTPPPEVERAGRRAGRVGRASRRGPLLQGAARDGRGAAAPRPLVGVARALRRALLAAAGRLLERLRAPGRLRHGALHDARARPERRRRLGRAARPRLRRLLRDRRVHVRDPRLRQVRLPPADAARSALRRRCSARSRA